MRKSMYCRSASMLAAASLLFAACAGNPGAGEPVVQPSVSASASPSVFPPPSMSPMPTRSPQPSLEPSPDVTPSSSPNSGLSPALSPKVSATPKETTKPASSAVEAGRKALSWYYMKKKPGEVPGFPNDLKQLKPNQKVSWVGTGKKVYLTFDTGGPLGESDKLLQILKDNGVKAAFFLVGYNVKQYQAFTKKVSDEGHLIGNHTMTHKDMTALSDETVKKELDEFAALIQEVTGKPVAPLFRFPYGKYSMHLLDLVSGMGYTSVFWSTAMRDWEPRAGGADDAYNDIMNGLHDGNVILMHQGSKENIEALDRIIKDIKKAGYEFASLKDLMK